MSEERNDPRLHLVEMTIPPGAQAHIHSTRFTICIIAVPGPDPHSALQTARRMQPSLSADYFRVVESDRPWAIVEHELLTEVEYRSRRYAQHRASEARRRAAAEDGSVDEVADMDAESWAEV